MLNYEKRLFVATYCIHFEGLIQLDAEAPTINKEILVDRPRWSSQCSHIMKSFSSSNDISYVHIGETLNTYI